MTLNTIGLALGNKRTVWIAGAAAAFVAVFLLFYGLSPYFAAGALASALKTGDADRLEQLIDFPSVREHLKDDLKAQMMSKMASDPQLKNNPFAGLGMLLGPAIVDRIVDSMVTPAMISTAIKNRQADAGGQSGEAGAASSPGPLSHARSGYDGFNRFKISATSRDGSMFAFIMTRQGLFGWRVTRMQLPADMLKDNGSSPAMAAPTDTAVPATLPTETAPEAYPAAKTAAADFIVSHPGASDAEAIAVAVAAARSVGDPDAARTGADVLSDAKDWAAERKSNGYPARNTPAELAANDAIADAAERKRIANISPAQRKLYGAAFEAGDPSTGAHYFPKVGTCFDTQVASISSRLENTPDSGDEVSYTDGHAQTTYDKSAVVSSFRVGDPVRLCVTELPAHCPPGDDRGIVFAAVDARTGGRWEAPDSEHQCGGA